MVRDVFYQKPIWVGVVIGLLALNVYQYTTGCITSDSRLGEQEVLERFHRMAYETQFDNRWLGVITWQNPSDVWIIQEIITEVRPDFIVEAGTLFGGSAALWATVLQQVNPEGRVITIDIKDLASPAKQLPIVQQKVDFLVGSSTAPEIVAEVEKRVRGHKVLVILDSDHHKEHVLKEMKAYAALVSISSYLIVQDTNINGHPVVEDFGPGPMEAVEAFLAQNDQFQPDRSRERLLFTMHPRGYLKRVK